MKERHKKKLVELNQGQTVSEREVYLIFVASAVALVVLVLFFKDQMAANLVSNVFRFESSGFLLGIFLSLINLRAWAGLVNTLSGKGSAISFLVLKLTLLAAVFVLLISSSSSFILSVLGGFLLHIMSAIFLIFLLFILRP